MVSETAPRIAIDARLVGGQSTGDSTYWTGLVAGLSRVNTNYRFLLFSNARRPPGIPESERFEWIRVPARSSRWWSYARFPLLARRMNASAIHTQYSLSPLAGNLGITTVHDVSFFIGPEWFKAKDRAILRTTVPAAARRAARIITVSDTSKGEIAKYISGIEDKIRVTYPAAHPGIAPIKKLAAKQKIKKNLGIDGPFVLTVGTIWPRKNTQLAVEAMSLLPAAIRRELVLTGKSGWGSGYKPQATSHKPFSTGYVTFEDLSALYSAADLYLAPSRHEGFGIPLIEAFHCGCPVLCSSGGALPETAGNAAEIEPTWDAEHWAKTIQSLLQDSSKLDQLRAKGLERAKRFTWEETARKTLQVYKEVAE
jgi:glycosyltransferase involved in cell wall biosynthesis